MSLSYWKLFNDPAAALEIFVSSELLRVLPMN
jgi:hypothetical protein